MTDENRESAKSPKTSPWKRLLLGIYLLLMPILLAYAVFALWPVADVNGTAEGPAWKQDARVLWLKGSLPDESRLLLLVLLTGALGSYVHAATSFASYVGNETLRYSWLWWYLLRPLIGMALALIFYFVIRGGFLSPATTDAQAISLYGIAAVAGLVGMFSKQATDKLNETFTTLFRTSQGEGDDARKDKLDRLEPVKSVMIPLAKIEKVVLSPGETAKDLKLGDLVDKLGPTVTRIPVIDAEERGKYVIHEGLLCRYIAQQARTGTFDVNTSTLEEFLEDPRNRTLVEALAFVALEATLAEAREAMEKVEHCRDAFVTEHGKKDERVIGWLTNVDIAKRLGT